MYVNRPKAIDTRYSFRVGNINAECLHALDIARKFKQRSTVS
jgi:hypothetical protein